jgi:hypothetical protein
MMTEHEVLTVDTLTWIFDCRASSHDSTYMGFYDLVLLNAAIPVMLRSNSALKGTHRTH